MRIVYTQFTLLVRLLAATKTRYPKGREAAMRFVIRLFLFSTLALAAGVNLLAQRGGSAGAHAGAPTARGLAPAGGGRPFPVPSGFPAPLGLQSPAAGYTGIRPGALNSRGPFVRDYRRIPYSYFFIPYYDSSFGYGYPGYDTYPYSPPVDPNAQGLIENALGEQIQRLSDEIEQLKYNQAFPPSAYQQPDPQSRQVPITLVLRSGQQIQVQNYAVIDQVFWDFTKQPARKIPISTIDVAASTKATEANGGEFPQLEPGQ